MDVGQPHRESLSVCLHADVALPVIGGAQTVLDQLARTLLAAGHRPLVVAPAARGDWDDGVFPYPIVRHRRARSKRFGTRLLLPRLLHLHRRHRFDLVHCHSAYPPAHVARSLRRLTGLPYVVRPHGADILPGDAVRSSPRLERRMLAAVRQADGVIAQGAYLRDVALEAGVSADRVHVINNGVDMAAFATAGPFDHPRPYVLGLGSLVPHKGFDLLVRGFALAGARGADLLIAGEGPERIPLQALAETLGVGERVHLLGNITGARKVSLYRSAELFACPSRREPFANVVLEAFASGTPVVATDVGGNRELLQGGDAGILCTPESPESLAVAIRRVLDDAAFARRLRCRGLEVATSHDWSEVVRQYVACYRTVLCAQASGRVRDSGRL
jgi:glycosyltransferase involved in cell wall biosynthesis